MYNMKASKATSRRLALHFALWSSLWALAGTLNAQGASVGSSGVSAQTLSPVPVDPWLPALDASGILDVESAVKREHLDTHVALSYAYAAGPLDPIVNSRQSARVRASLALWRRIRLGFDIPFVVAHDATLGEARGLGAMRFQLATQLTRASLHNIDLQMGMNLSLPGVAPADDLIAPSTWAIAPYFALGRTFDSGFRAYMNFGGVFRPAERVNSQLEIGQEVDARLGLAYEIGASSQFPVGLQTSISTRHQVYPSAAVRGQQAWLQSSGGLYLKIMRRLKAEVFGSYSILRRDGLPTWRVGGGLAWVPSGALDADGDGILDERDQCDQESEDFDGFEDSDGCPDFDNDKDDIFDEEDRCPSEAEDHDAFQDDDGCPDTDNDGDGIIDGNDQCPNHAEDFDGLDDDDGCPDADNDGDGIDDGQDQCPSEAEDRDGFQDDDGCPDEDNDGDKVADRDDKCPFAKGPARLQGCPAIDRDDDGVLDELDLCPDVAGLQENQGCPVNDADGDGLLDHLDTCPDDKGAPYLSGCPDHDRDGIHDLADQCPQSPENINLVEDQDGCPEKSPRALVKRYPKSFSLRQAIVFDPSISEIRETSLVVVDHLAAYLKVHPEVELVKIESHSDDRGGSKANMRKTQKKAELIRDALVDRGVDGSRIKAVGLGQSLPIADNFTAEGRRQNNRLEFHILKDVSRRR